MSQEAQSIAKQIQELENLQNTMLESANFDYDVFETGYQEIIALESQQNKILDEAKYLEEADIQRIYEENGGKESTAYAAEIRRTAGLEGYFDKFIKDDKLTSQVVFVNRDPHWMTVRLEKTQGGITYQVADSFGCCLATFLFSKYFGGRCVIGCFTAFFGFC